MSGGGGRGGGEEEREEREEREGEGDASEKNELVILKDPGKRTGSEVYHEESSSASPNLCVVYGVV